MADGVWGVHCRPDPRRESFGSSSSLGASMDLGFSVDIIIFLGKVHLTPSNYHSNDNLPLKQSIATIYPPNYQSNDDVPPIFKKWWNYPYQNKNKNTKI
jgi:hypothetical protein